jgi:hypothetical protein
MFTLGKVCFSDGYFGMSSKYALSVYIYVGTFTLGGGCSALCLQAGLSVFRSHCANTRLHEVEFSNGDQP